MGIGQPRIIIITINENKIGLKISKKHAFLFESQFMSIRHNVDQVDIVSFTSVILEFAVKPLKREERRDRAR